MNLLKDKNAITEALAACKESFRSLTLFSAAINVLALTPSIYMLQVYDRVLASGNETTLVMLTLIAIGLYVLAAMLESSRTFILVRVGNRLDMKLNDQVYNSAYQLNLKGSSAANAGQAFRDLANVRQFLTGNGILAFFDTPWIPIYMAVIFLFHPLLGVLAVVGAIISVGLTYINNRKTSGPIAEANKLAIRSGSTADNTLRNAEVIQAMGMRESVKARWRQDHIEYLKLQSGASDEAAIWTHASKYFRIFLQSAALGLGGYLVIQGEMTPGMMIAASILIGRALAPIDQLIGVWKSFTGTKQAYQRLVDMLEATPETQLSMRLPDPKPTLSFEAVSAAPPGSRIPTVRNLTVTIPAGHIVGVIGPSGAGKSTFARLALGIWKPQVGTVRLDGADIFQYDREHIGPMLGYLPQDIELFAGTVAENIARLGEVDSEKVVEAARNAGIHDLILNLPEGYETILGHGGGGLSGGQRQRLGLARALYGNPKIVVLDEPNSNLDDLGEKALLDAIKQFKAMGHTVILITHKTNILTATDSLILLKDGLITKAGPTADILAQLQQSALAANQNNTRAK